MGRENDYMWAVFLGRRNVLVDEENGLFGNGFPKNWFSTPLTIILYNFRMVKDCDYSLCIFYILLRGDEFDGLILCMIILVCG